MSSCGKRGARVSGGKGAAGAAAVSVKTVSVFRLRAIKQLGHSPAGAFSESGAPHCGQGCDEVLLITNTYRSAADCYTGSRKWAARNGPEPDPSTRPSPHRMGGGR